jgi:predicted phosphodiesterase
MDRLGCDTIVCGGDIVDYGLFPDETLALLRTRKIPCVRGNHDRWAIGKGRAEAPGEGDDDTDAEDASGWDLSPESIRFLAELPKAWDAVIEGVCVAVRHASPRSDMDGIVEGIDAAAARRHLERAQADVLLVGHTHRAIVLETPSGAIIANPGALLRDPADDFQQRAMIFDPDAGKFVAEDALPTPGTFGILELPSKRLTVHRAKDGAEIEIPRVTLGFTKGWRSR